MKVERKGKGRKGRLMINVVPPTLNQLQAFILGWRPALDAVAIWAVFLAVLLPPEGVL